MNCFVVILNMFATFCTISVFRNMHRCKDSQDNEHLKKFFCYKRSLGSLVGNVVPKTDISDKTKYESIFFSATSSQ